MKLYLFASRNMENIKIGVQPADRPLPFMNCFV